MTKTDDSPPLSYNPCVPIYEHIYPMRAYIPESIAKFGSIFQDESLVLEDSTPSETAEVIELSNYLGDSPMELDDNGLPPSKTQKFIRGMILACYKYTKEKQSLGKSSTGHFRDDDVKIKHGVTKVIIHKSKDNLGVSIKMIIDEVHEEKLVGGLNNVLTDFLDNIEDCSTPNDFARLYYHPAVCSKKDTTYFLLDFSLLADFRGNFKNVLREHYKGVGTLIRKVPEFEQIKKKLESEKGKYDDTYGGALACAKTICGNEWHGTSLTLEEKMDKFLTTFPTMPCQVIKAMANFDFDLIEEFSG